MLADEKLDFSCGVNLNNEKTISSEDPYGKKTWHFRFDRCYMQEMTFSNKKTFRKISRMIRSNYRQTGKNTWEDSDNRVELKRISCYPKFVFYPRPRMF